MLFDIEGLPANYMKALAVSDIDVDYSQSNGPVNARYKTA